MELDTFIPIALELKRIKKKSDIRFLFLDKKNFEVISKSTTLLNALNRCNKIYNTTQYDNKILSFISFQIIKCKIIIWIFKSRCKAIFFPTFGLAKQNRILDFFLKILKVKKFLLWKVRAVDHTCVTNSKGITTSKESKKFFNGYIYYHSLQNDFLESLKSQNLIRKNNVFKIGLPGTSLAWRQFIKDESVMELKNLKKKFNNISNIYTIIGIKGYNVKKNLKNVTNASKQLKSLVEQIFLLDPNCVILYKTHPRDEKPEELFKLFDLNLLPRFVFTYIHTDVLSNISKVFFFVEPNNVISSSYNILKVNFANINDQYKEMMKIKKVKKENGYGDIRLDPNKDWKKKLNQIIFKTSLFKREKYFKKENHLIKNNKFNINRFIHRESL